MHRKTFLFFLNCNQFSQSFLLSTIHLNLLIACTHHTNWNCSSQFLNASVFIDFIHKSRYCDLEMRFSNGFHMPFRWSLFKIWAILCTIFLSFSHSHTHTQTHTLSQSSPYFCLFSTLIINCEIEYSVTLVEFKIYLSIYLSLVSLQRTYIYNWLID